VSVTIVVLNWNGLADTLRCLESLCRVDLGSYKIVIVVVDNASEEDPTPAITSQFPQVKILRLDENRGFTGGCNAGITWALAQGASFVCLLNNDAVVEPDFLQPMLESFKLEKNLSVVSPVIRRLEPPNEIEFAGGIICYALGRFSARRSTSSLSSPLHFCGYASGCCMLISRRVVDEIGLFDETFFAYFEDTDYSIRARAHGFQVACCLRSSIRHKGSASTRSGLKEGTTSPMKHYLVARNRLVLIRKHAPLVERAFFLFFVQPLIAVYYLIGFLLRRRKDKARAFVRGILDGLRNAPVRLESDRLS
jgi:GT2 family glycosyltransferase